MYLGSYFGGFSLLSLDPMCLAVLGGRREWWRGAVYFMVDRKQT